MKPGTIKTTLICVVVLLQLLSFAGVALSTKDRLHDQARMAVLQELDIKAKNLMIQAQQFLAPITSQLSISHQLVADGLLKTRDNNTLELYFLSQLRSNTAMHAMYLGRRDGSFVAVARFKKSLLKDYDEPVLRAKTVTVNVDSRQIEWREYSLDGEKLSQWSDKFDTFDPRVRDWYLNAGEQKTPVWTNAFSLTDSKQLAIAASISLTNSANESVGVLGMSVELSALNQLVAATSMVESGSITILDDQLNEIVGSLPAGALREQHAQAQSELAGSEKADLQLSSVDAHWFSDDDTVAVIQRRMHLFNGALKWRVLLEAPVIQLDEARKELVNDTVLRTLVIILMPGLFAVALIIWLSKPLQRLHRRATVDYLTLALNREEFINQFSQQMHRFSADTPQTHQWVAIALDLDGFKQINDQHGHDAGDTILKEVVARLHRSVGLAGHVGRLGGDEFAVALRMRSDVDVKMAVERLRRHVVKLPILSVQSTHHIGMTAGVARATGHETVSELMEQADRALIAGKVISKNATYTFASGNVHEKAAAANMPTVNRIITREAS